MIVEIIAVGLVVSAFLAVYLDEAVYSIASLAVTVTLLSALYFQLGGVYVAVFQFSVGVGTLIVLFLSGEMLSAWRKISTGRLKLVLGIAAAGLLSAIAVLTPAELGTSNAFSEVTFSTALWSFRAVDILAQGLVVLTVALGIAILLKRERENNY